MAHAHAPVWNVGAAVGKNQPNRPDDVLLVQRLLIGLASTPAAFTRPPTPLQPTGIFDDNLSLWIKAFQTALAAKTPGKFVVDGVVSPMPSPTGVDWNARFAAGAFSTLAALNLSLRGRSPTLHANAGAGLQERLDPP
jgi:hypothetical protein